ncbi:unnamed protein product [Adineta steineri]|uniref:Uncharacterized protein n=1 Tax=Adineta steineri TaxID=433720 RepID=A0A815H543_9BILA|nr:unnamed protein product [Adineta steineri]
MGLSAFEDSSSSHSYCSQSLNQSLTKRLIELSNIPSKSSSRFAHTPDWADGLDIWSSAQNSSTKTDLTRRNLDFHHDIGIYLPRYEKPKSAPICLKNLQINPKILKNNLPPERIRHLLKKEKDLLSENDWSDQPIVIDIPSQVPANTFRSSTSLDLSSTAADYRLPLRHVTNKSSTPDQQLNQDALKSLLEEHLTSLLTRGASTINANRTIINVPSNDERHGKRDEFIPSPLSTISTQQIKINQTSHFIVQQKSPLGLTVTPVDSSPQKNFQSISLEKLAQQRSFHQDNEISSATSSNRPSTEPVSFPPPPPTHRYLQQQKVILKRNLDTSNTSSTGDLSITNENSSNKLFEQSQIVQNIRKGGHTHHHHHHSSSSKTKFNRTNNNSPKTTTIEILPPIVSGKRVHISLANHRYL